MKEQQLKAKISKLSKMFQSNYDKIRVLKDKNLKLDEQLCELEGKLKQIQDNETESN